MVRVLRKVIEKRVDCPQCGCELSFDDSDEKCYSDHTFDNFNKARFICCPCGCCIQTRDINGDMSKNIMLMTVEANDE